MMKRRALNLFIVALGLGLGAAWLANKWIQARLAPVAQANTSPVVVAALEIPFGQKIAPSHLKTVGWPNENLPGGVYKDVAEVEGKIANQRIYAGEPLIQGRIVDQGVGSTLSAIITPKMRAVTVRVDDVIGVAGFLLPGNRVDVIATREQDNRRAYTETILENLKVLAVDQTATPEEDKPVVVRAVTLEMHPDQVERLTKATAEGKLQLALRNPTDDTQVVKAEEKPVPVAAAPVVAAAPRKRPRIYTSAITVIRGTKVKVSRTLL